MKELYDFVAECGYAIPPESLILDGKIHRFPFEGSKDAGWFIGWIYNYAKRDGQYEVAVIADWKTGSIRTYAPASLSKHEKDAAKKQVKEAQSQFEAERKKHEAEAEIKAREIFGSAAESGLTAYLERKKLNGLYGARELKGSIWVPVRTIEGQLKGLQQILPDGKKLFIRGTAVKGCFHLIGGSLDDQLIYICEGYATAVSIHMATKGTVIVAFNASNLSPVAQALRFKNQKAQIVICGDDDRFTVVQGKPKNPGREEAERAASNAQATAIFPCFTSDEERLTDFNDLHCSEGLDAVRSQLQAAPEREDGFIALGYDEGTHFYYHIGSKDIVKVSHFSKPEMFQLAPLGFWQANYSLADSKTDWTRAQNDLIQASRKVGQFDSRKVRGTGVWLDAGRIVINRGDELSVDRKKTSLSQFASDYRYVKTTNRLAPLDEPLSAEECRPLIDALSSLKWRDDVSGQLLAGWLAISRIAGALPVRPHVWITGGSGTGKSTVMENIISKCLGAESGRLYLQGSSTEAGIRQRIRASSIPIIFDEFEPSGEASKKRLEDIIDLLRNSWGATKGVIAKGTPGGHSIEYQLSFACLVSSIRVWLDDAADRSRFSVLELEPHGSNAEQWSRVRVAMVGIDERFGERLFSRVAGMIPVILYNYELLQTALALAVTQRYGQQVGMLLAGYQALVSDEKMSTEDARRLIDEYVLITAEEHQDNVSDELECLKHFLTSMIEIQTSDFSRSKMTIETILSEHNEVRWAELKNYGIKRTADAIFIDQSHRQVKALYAKTKWSLSWSRSILRLPGAKKTVGVRFGKFKPSQRCIEIPLSILS